MSPTPTLPWSHVEQRLHSASSTRTSRSGGCSCWRRTRGNGRPNAGSASGGDGHTWTSTWGKNRDKIIRLNPNITDGKGKLEKVWMALTGAGGSGALVQVAAVRAGAGERIAQNPAVAEEVARPVSLPPEEPPGLEVVRGNGNGGLLSGLTPGVNSLTLSGVPIDTNTSSCPDVWGISWTTCCG